MNTRKTSTDGESGVGGGGGVGGKGAGDVVGWLVKNLEILGSCDVTITVLSPFATDLRIYLKQARARVNKLQKDKVKAKAVGNNSQFFFHTNSSVHTSSFPQAVDLTRFHPSISDKKK